MSRASVKTKKIDGVVYYTSTYFAEKVYLNKRGAREFLESFQSLKGHTNPRLFEKKIMDKAIAAFTEGKRNKEEYDKIRKEVLEKKEDERLQREEEWWEVQTQNEPVVGGESLSIDSYKTYLYIEKKYNESLPLMMLERLLYLNGYEFDKKEYKKDFFLNAEIEMIREEGTERTLEHQDVLEKLESNDSYLKPL